MGKFSNEKFDHDSFSTKKCPYCHTYLPIDTEKCSYCGKNVGEVEQNGMARKPTDWISYVVCIVAWIVFIVYIGWAFF